MESSEQLIETPRRLKILSPLLPSALSRQFPEQIARSSVALNLRRVFRKVFHKYPRFFEFWRFFSVIFCFLLRKFICKFIFHWRLLRFLIINVYIFCGNTSYCKFFLYISRRQSGATRSSILLSMDTWNMANCYSSGIVVRSVELAFNFLGTFFCCRW